MAEDGIVGQYNGSQARDILITLADWERMQGLSSGDEADKPVAAVARSNGGAPPRRNIVKPEPWNDDTDASVDEELVDEDGSDDESAENKSLEGGGEPDDDYQAQGA